MSAIAASTAPGREDHETSINIINMREVKELKREKGKSRVELEAASYVRSLRLEVETLRILHTNDRDEGHRRGEKVGRTHTLDKSRMTYKLSKFLLETIGRFCFVDLMARANYKNEANRIRFGWWWPLSKLENRLHFHRLARSNWFMEHKSRRFGPRVALALWLLSCAHVLVFMTRQYRYDFHRFRLKRVQWLNLTHHEVYLKLGLEGEDDLREQVAASREALLAVGALTGDSGYLPQCFCWLLLIVTLLSYAFAGFFTKYHTPFDFYILRNFLDHTQEQHNCRQLVERQAHHFVESARSYTQALMEFSELSLGKRLFSQSRGGQTRSQVVAGAERLPASLSAGARWSRDHPKPASELDGCADKLAPSITPLDSLSCRQMARMMACGLLAPVNQSTDWVARQIDRYAYMKIAIIGYCLLMNLVFVCYCYARGGSRSLSWRDLLLASELLFLQTVCNVTTVFYSFSVMFCCYDQIKLVNQLRKLIRHVVALNRLRFYAILRPAHRRQQQQRQQQVAPTFQISPSSRHTRRALRRRRGAINTLLDTGPPDRPLDRTRPTAARRLSLPESPRDFRRESPTRAMDGPNLQPLDRLADLANKMNNDLLLAIMHYRVFFARMVSLIEPFGAVALIATVLMFLVPFVGRLHLSYFLQPFERSAIVLASCVILIPVNVALIGPAVMHRRGLDLYGSLNSLLAHAMDIANQPEGRHIYDRHLMSILRKELAMHDGVTPKFATRAVGLSFTYPNLVRLHFYLGFLLLSIIAENQSGEQELTGTIFNDPFGLF